MPKKSGRRKKPQEPPGPSSLTNLAADLQPAEAWNRLHHEIWNDLNRRALAASPSQAKLLGGFLEIANIMLKNTVGIGSNFKLAETNLAFIDASKILAYYGLILTVLGYHVGQLMPAQRDAVWQAVLSVAPDPTACADFSAELAECKDYQDGSFSPVRAGRRLWERVAALFALPAPGDNTTARIYYQTAPGQDLVFLLEKAVNEGWLREKTK